MAELKLCRIEGCGKPAYRAELCNPHRIRVRRYGDPLIAKRRVDPNNCGKKECPAAKKVWGHIHYLNNSKIYKDNARRWREENPEAYEARNAAYFSREDVKQKMRQKTKDWNAANPERKRQMDVEFKQKNGALITSYKAKYRAARRKATPPWLTKDDLSKIHQVYAEAKRLSVETGVPYEVDHIVPLAGKVVSGLHVPWNLRAIPKVENNRRPRIYQFD